jgi:hypothetical protein
MSEEGFLSRWSRRKRAAEAGEPVAETDAAAAMPAPVPGAAPPPADGVLAPAPVAAAAVVPEEPPFDIATLPSIDSLTVASDFTAFLRKEVPEALKRAALRRAWSLDPAIRDFVGPADYAWDYNAPDGVPGFSLELIGDVKELLAQVFGPEPAEASAPQPDLPLQAAAPEGDLPAEAPADPAGAAEPAEAPAPLLAEADPPAMAATPAEPDVAPRRHGSALPG